MTNPVHQLKRLLAQPATASRGKVVAVVGSTVNVATQQGVVSLPNSGGYKAGDEVVMRGGAIQGRRQSEASIPVFIV